MSRTVRKNPVVEEILIKRVAPSVLTLSHIHAEDRVGSYREYPVCTGHILTIVWGKKSASYTGARAFFFKKRSHWNFLMGDKEYELTPGARAKNTDEEVYQMLIKRFLGMNPGKGSLPPQLGQHADEAL